jgi:hypothetical protein
MLEWSATKSQLVDDKDHPNHSISIWSILGLSQKVGARGHHSPICMLWQNKPNHVLVIRTEYEDEAPSVLVHRATAIDILYYDIPGVHLEHVAVL